MSHWEENLPLYMVLAQLGISMQEHERCSSQDRLRLAVW